MNKYEKAFERVTDWFHAYRDKKGILVQEQHVTEEYLIQREILWKLVEKETPKKPLPCSVSITNGYSYYFYICPKCKRTINVANPFPKYCEECGQKIKWKE